MGMADEATNTCMACSAEFNAIIRKHHCRHCGQIFCNACTSTVCGNRVCQSCAVVLGSMGEGLANLSASSPEGADTQCVLLNGMLNTVFAKQFEVLIALAVPKMREYRSKLRPWKQFAVVQKPELSWNAQMQSHIERNLQHFEANYVAILALMLILIVLSHPVRIIAVTILALSWSSYVGRGGLDPNWLPKVGGVELPSSHRLLIGCAASVAFMFLVDGEALLAMGGLSALAMLCHAVASPGPTLAAAAAATISMDVI